MGPDRGGPRCGIDGLEGLRGAHSARRGLTEGRVAAGLGESGLRGLLCIAAAGRQAGSRGDPALDRSAGGLVGEQGGAHHAAEPAAPHHFDF